MFRRAEADRSPGGDPQLGRVLSVDPVACDGVGVCAHLFGDRITMDDWGYPIIDPSPLNVGEERRAERAVASCPRHALFLRPGRRS
ncbi:MAG: ferredoxin [Actinomycetes bacterium]